MVSIQFPGAAEKRLEFTQWVPDMPEEQVRKITDAKRLEEVLNEINHKIEKLEESQLALKEFQEEERKQNWPAGESSSPEKSGDVSMTQEENEAKREKAEELFEVSAALIENGYILDQMIRYRTFVESCLKRVVFAGGVAL